MSYELLKLNQPVHYYKSGEFMSTDNWRHSKIINYPDYELIFCLHGPLYLKIGMKEMVLNKNDVCFVPPSTPIVGTTYTSEPVNFYWLHFIPNAHQTITDHNAQLIMDKTKKKTTNIILPQKFNLLEADDTLLRIHQILSIHNDNQLIDERDFLISALLINLETNYLKQSENQDERPEFYRIEAIKEWIRSNISSELSVSQIAQQFNLNVDYMSRTFKKNTNMTISSYINNIKIEVASLLLIRTSLTVKKIAYNSYFTNEKTFIRCFKRVTGVTPSEFRKSNALIHHNNPYIDPAIPIPKRIAHFLK